MMRVILFTVLSILLMSSAYGGSPGTKGARFLIIGMGSRPTSMGGAFCAYRGDINSIHWNPAGLSTIGRREILAMYSEWLSLIKIGYLAYALPISEDWTLGMSITYLLTDKLTKRDEDGKIIGDFHNYYYALNGVISYHFLPRTSLGISLKSIHGNLGGKKTFGLAMDIGIIHEILYDKLEIGFVVQNQGLIQMKFIDKEDSMPLNFKLGAAYRLKEMLITSDINKPIDDEFLYSIGIEYRLWQSIALRGGYRFKKGDNAAYTGITAGFGLRKACYKIDYAYVPYEDLGNAHRFSFGMIF